MSSAAWRAGLADRQRGRAGICPAPLLAGLVVAGFAAFLLLFRLGATHAPIWDEAYYLPATARYHQGTAQFASHPPLGLMLIAAGDTVLGRNAAVDQSRMAAVKSIRAEQMPADYDYLGPRLAPAAAGTVAAVLFLLLMCRMTGSTSAGLLASSLLLLDPAILVQFRAAQLDAFQIAFLLAALLLLTQAVRTPCGAVFAGFGCCVMLAALVRANGILIGIGGVVVIAWQLRPLGLARSAAHALAGLGGGLAALAAVALAYTAVSTHPPDPLTEAGRKDAAFVSAEHRQALETGQWTLAATRAALNDHARFIAADLAGVPASDPNGSHPLEWLVGIGGIVYRAAWDGGRQSAIALVPNRIAWCLSFIGVLLTVLRPRRQPLELALPLLAIWIASMASLIVLQNERVLYAYHYFIPLVCGHALAALNWRWLPRRDHIANGANAALLAWFSLCMPVVYNVPIPHWACGLMQVAPCHRN